MAVQNPNPSAPARNDERFEIEFDPVPRRNRIDGCSPERQRTLVSAYAECGCIIEACERVGISRSAYYALTRHPQSADFRRAVRLARRHSVQRLIEQTHSRGIHGVTIPHYYKGELVGTHQRFNDRLAMFLLQRYAPEEFGTPEERSKAIDETEVRALELEKETRKVEKHAHDREIAHIPYAIEMEQDEDEWLEMKIEAELHKHAGRVARRDGTEGRMPHDVVSTLYTSAAFPFAMRTPSPSEAPSPP